MLLLDRPLDQQEQAWQHQIDNAGDDRVKWKNLQIEARQSIKYGDDPQSQAWRYEYLIHEARNVKHVEQLVDRAIEDDVMNDGIDRAQAARVQFLEAMA